VGYLGANRATLAAWQTATGKEANGKNTDPVFTGTTNLLPTNTALGQLGTYLSMVATDYAGTNRTRSS